MGTTMNISQVGSNDSGKNRLIESFLKTLSPEAYVDNSNSTKEYDAISNYISKNAQDADVTLQEDGSTRTAETNKISTKNSILSMLQAKKQSVATAGINAEQVQAQLNEIYAQRAALMAQGIELINQLAENPDSDLLSNSTYLQIVEQDNALATQQAALETQLESSPSTKQSTLTSYQTELDQIADGMAELVMLRYELKQAAVERCNELASDPEAVMDDDPDYQAMALQDRQYEQALLLLDRQYSAMETKIARAEGKETSGTNDSLAETLKDAYSTKMISSMTYELMALEQKSQVLDYRASYLAAEAASDPNVPLENSPVYQNMVWQKEQYAEQQQQLETKITSLKEQGYSVNVNDVKSISALSDIGYSIENLNLDISKLKAQMENTANKSSYNDMAWQLERYEQQLKDLKTQYNLAYENLSAEDKAALSGENTATESESPFFDIANKELTEVIAQRKAIAAQSAALEKAAAATPGSVLSDNPEYQALAWQDRELLKQQLTLESNLKIGTTLPQAVKDKVKAALANYTPAASTTYKSKTNTSSQSTQNSSLLDKMKLAGS